MAQGARSAQVAMARRMRASGAPWAEIAEALQLHHGVGALQAMRVAHGWRLQDAVDRWQERWPDQKPLNVNRLSGWECWPASGHPVALPELIQLAELYECDVTDLVAGLADFTHLDAYPESVDRRSFLVGAATSAALTATPFPALPVGRIGSSDVARLRADVAALYAADDAAGGAATFQRALNQAAAVRRLLDEASYIPTVGRDLQVLAGELTEHAAWSAYDQRRHDDARRLWSEALLLANTSGSSSLATIVMAAMSLQASAVGAGRQAVELARAAQKTADGHGSARLLSLLAAREALGHAKAGDGKAMGEAFRRAEVLLDDDGESPDWLAFWGPADFHAAVGVAHLDLGAAPAAERACRSAIAATPKHYARNRSLYGGYLAEALVAQNAVEEAAGAATTALKGVCSGRLRSRLHAMRPTFEAHASKPLVADCLERLDALAQ